MRWPWVSRTAFDLVVAERDILRERNDDLVDNLKRIQRVRQGMREAPRVHRPRPDPIEPIPPEINDLYAGFQSEAVRNDTEMAIRELRQKGTPWSEIQRVLEAQVAT